MRRLLLSATILLASAGALPAGELFFGIGQTGFHDGGEAEATTLSVEAHSEALRRFGRVELRFAGAVEVDADSDVFAGIGLAAVAPLGRDWRVVGSLLPGYYGRGDGYDLGGEVQFRSLVELARRAGPGWLGLAVSHKSNAGIEERNPGEDTLMLRYAVRF